jgi:pimeloyl-ACP methyl ester carboxylesterase
MCAPAAARLGLRLIWIDRPGYGRSTPEIGRTIGGWVPDALAVVDHLGIDRFVSVGASTGGAYALALAAQSRRVIGAVACCALTDMRWSDGRDMIPSAHPVWAGADSTGSIRNRGRAVW